MDIRNFVSYNYPQHSFLHNFLEGAGQVAEEVGSEVAEEVTRLGDLQKEILDVATKKLKIYKDKAKSPEYAKQLEKLIKRLKTLDTKKSLLLFGAKAYSELKTAKTEIDSLIQSGKFTEQDLYKFKDYVYHYVN